MFQMFRDRVCTCAYACVRAYAYAYASKVGSRTGRQLALTAALSAARTHTHRQDGVYPLGKAHMYPSSGYNLNNSTLPESERASRNQAETAAAPAASVCIHPGSPATNFRAFFKRRNNRVGMQRSRGDDDKQILKLQPFVFLHFQ